MRINYEFAILCFMSINIILLAILLYVRNQSKETIKNLNEKTPDNSTVLNLEKEPLLINKGIINCRNNCYASSVFQCINSVETFREYFTKILDENKPVSFEIKKILMSLNSTSPINIKSNLTKMSEDPSIKYSMNLFTENDVKEFYELILSATIKEECGIPADREFYLFNDEFYEKNNLTNSFLIKNCIILRKGNASNKAPLSRHCPILDVVYTSDTDLERSFLNSFLKDYDPEPSNNKILVISIETGGNDNLNVKVTNQIHYNGKCYVLRSFCVNKGGHNGHYIARVVSGEKLIEYDDKNVKETALDDSKGEGRVRLAFYEIDET